MIGMVVGQGRMVSEDGVMHTRHVRGKHGHTWERGIYAGRVRGRGGFGEAREENTNTMQDGMKENAKKRPPVFFYGGHSTVGVADTTMSGLGNVQRGDRVTLSEEEARHARTVLRLEDGNLVQLCDGRGMTVDGRVEYDSVDSEGRTARGGGKKRVRSKGSSGARQVYVTIVKEPIQHSLPTRRWHVAVACGSLKGGRADWLVEKCAEVGAARLTPLLTERSPEMKREAERWERLTVSVMKQSLQPYRMEICTPLGLDSFLEQCCHGVAAYVGAEDASCTFAAALDGNVMEGKNMEECVLIIGPEGDFTLNELDSMVGRGVVPVTLGNRRLRTETAAISMLAYAVIHTGT